MRANRKLEQGGGVLRSLSIGGIEEKNVACHSEHIRFAQYKLREESRIHEFIEAWDSSFATLSQNDSPKQYATPPLLPPAVVVPQN